MKFCISSVYFQYLMTIRTLPFDYIYCDDLKLYILIQKNLQKLADESLTQRISNTIHRDFTKQIPIPFLKAPFSYPVIGMLHADQTWIMPTENESITI